MNLVMAFLVSLIIVGQSASAFAQVAPATDPPLQETLDWLGSTLSAHSSDSPANGGGIQWGLTREPQRPCMITLTEKYVHRSYFFGAIYDLDLSVLDLDDLQLAYKVGNGSVLMIKVREGKLAIHRASYNGPRVKDPIDYDDLAQTYIFMDSADSAARATKALHHAVELCGGKGTKQLF
jgi:hypothetical protein